jgi:antitoxin MazE
MIKMLTKIGNSYGIIIERPVLELLQIDPGKAVEVTTVDGALVVRPLPDRKARVRQAAKHMAKVHHKTLKDLAD